MADLGLTESIARFVATPIGDVDRDVAEIVTRGFTDCIATMVAGRNEPVVGVVNKFVEARKTGVEEASLLLGAARVASCDAALINGTAAHALDYDDVALGGHPSAVLVPAVFAEGETLNASGADALRAYLVGYEVWAELASRDPDSYHEKGWHPTAVLGTVGAASAACYLHRLDSTACRHALAIAASMASGLVANFGSMTKSLHAGRAASNGIAAVHMAKAGLTASRDVLEHAQGYLAALSPGGRADRWSQATRLGHDWRILDQGLSIKKYPVCYAAHRAIDGVLDLVTAEDIRPEDVETVSVSIGSAQSVMLRNRRPQTALEAKFSLEFAIASSLVARKVSLSELTDDFVNMPSVREAMTKVGSQATDTRCPVEPAFSFADRVTITLKNGRHLDSGDIRFARGNAKLPLRDDELAAKFFDCTSGSNHIDAEHLYDSVTNLQELDSLRSLSGRPR